MALLTTPGAAGAAAEAGDAQLILILDDDSSITEGLALGLEHEGRTVVLCNDVESAELIVEQMNPTHIVADIRISGPFGFEGLDFIRFARMHARDSCFILISGDAPEALQREASERGASAFLQKPFSIGELDSTIDRLRCSSARSSGGRERIIRMALLDDVLSSEALRPEFQPIVRLGSPQPAIFGFESLARFRVDSPLRTRKWLARVRGACMNQVLESPHA